MSKKTILSNEKLGYICWIAILSFFLIPLIVLAFIKYAYLMFIILLFVYIFILVVFGKKINIVEEKILSYNKFLKDGRLIKDVPFYKHVIYFDKLLKSSPTTFFAVVDYTTKDGKTVTLGRYEEFSLKDYGDRTTMDLFIDEDNIENYIIGFDLEEQIKNNELY